MKPDQFADTLVSLMKSTFKDIPPADTLYMIEQNGEDEYTINFNWIGIDTGYPVEHESIIETFTRPGFRVWRGEVKSGGHWEPDYVDDVTIVETTYWGKAIQACLEQYLADKTQGFWDAREAESMIADRKLAETYEE